MDKRFKIDCISEEEQSLQLRDLHRAENLFARLVAQCLIEGSIKNETAFVDNRSDSGIRGSSSSEDDEQE